MGFSTPLSQIHDFRTGSFLWAVILLVREVKRGWTVLEPDLELSALSSQWGTLWFLCSLWTDDGLPGRVTWWSRWEVGVHKRWHWFPRYGNLVWSGRKLTRVGVNLSDESRQGKKPGVVNNSQWPPYGFYQRNCLQKEVCCLHLPWLADYFLRCHVIDDPLRRLVVPQSGRGKAKPLKVANLFWGKYFQASFCHWGVALHSCYSHQLRRRNQARRRRNLS